jgi:SAM-dependent methyltransferase
MIDPKVCDRMRDDWNSRAGEDANYYVAFGRRDQSEEEFLDTAREVVHGLEWELKRIPRQAGRACRALEIGCGPGRLMRPMSRHFDEIHGIDVSGEMIRLARERLRGIPHAHAQVSSGADLTSFADDFFDFVYSYAVFQHIPSREVVFQYLAETRRVLRVGGILRCQVNGLPETAAHYDTWCGVRISGAEIAAFAAEHDFQLLALEGVSTQYLWTTWRKRPDGWRTSLAATKPACQARIRRVTNAHSSEPVAPPRGRFASVSVWVEQLPEDCDLNTLDILIGGKKSLGTYIGPREADGLQQVNACLPEGLDTGLQPLELRWLDALIAAPSRLRVIPPAPAVPRVVAVCDGVDLLSGTKIVSRSLKVTLEEASEPHRFQASIDGRPVSGIEVFCTDPRPPRHEVNFQLPDGLGAGAYTLEMRLGPRRFAPVEIVVA